MAAAAASQLAGRYSHPGNPGQWRCMEGCPPPSRVVTRSDRRHHGRRWRCRAGDRAQRSHLGSPIDDDRRLGDRHRRRRTRRPGGPTGGSPSTSWRARSSEVAQSRRWTSGNCRYWMARPKRRSGRNSPSPGCAFGVA